MGIITSISKGTMGNKEAKQRKNIDKLMDAQLEFKMQANMMAKQANKDQANAEAQKKKAKTYMDKGDMESAKVIAGEAIRYQSSATNMHKMSGKMLAVSSKLESAVRSQELSMQIQQAVPSMNNALKAMGKNGIGNDMAAFEKVFEDLDVQIAGTDGALESITGQSSADSDAVTQLLQQMMGEGVIE